MRTLGQHLATRLVEIGVTHVFGVPGTCRPECAHWFPVLAGTPCAHVLSIFMTGPVLLLAGDFNLVLLDQVTSVNSSCGHPCCTGATLSGEACLNCLWRRYQTHMGRCRRQIGQEADLSTLRSAECWRASAAPDRSALDVGRLLQ